VIIRPANEGEAAVLSALALESKQQWGYSPRTFYVACCAVRRGTVAAPTAEDPGRCRPQLLLEIAVAARGCKSPEEHPPWL